MPVLQISPNSELTFKGPFTDVVVSDISLRNISENRACFKIKTTAPKQYCVRPNCGLVEPGSTAVVTVMLQPFHYDVKMKIKHKFLVLSMPAPSIPVESVEQLWKDPPTDGVFETKLRCVFYPSADTKQPSKDTSKTHQPTTVVDSAPVPPPKHVSRGKSKPDVLPVKTDDALAAEHKKLVEENNELKQETQRLRKLMMSSSTSTNYMPVNPSAEPSSNAIDLFTVGFIAVVAIVFGLIIGKYVV